METESIQTFINSRGEVLRRWSSSNSKCPKAVCIVVHGLHDHMTAYEDMAMFMMKHHDIVMLGYDQVGHGLSEGRRADIDKFSYYVEDLLQFVNLIKSEYKSIPLFIMGHNMGGLVLGLALLKDESLCDGAIMYSAFINAHPKFVFSKWVHRMSSDTLRYQGGIKARLAQNLFDAVDEFVPRMSLLTTPMLILHGTDDKVCLLNGSQMLHESIKSQENSLKIYQDSYHRLHAEPKATSDTFAADVCDWINRQVKLKHA